jgi:hypothetical protein
MGEGSRSRIVAGEKNGRPGSGALPEQLGDIAQLFGKLPCPRPQLHGFAGGIALGDLEHAHEPTANLKLSPVAGLGGRQALK